MYEFKNITRTTEITSWIFGFFLGILLTCSTVLREMVWRQRWFRLSTSLTLVRRSRTCSRNLLRRSAQSWTRRRRCCRFDHSCDTRMNRRSGMNRKLEVFGALTICLLTSNIAPNTHLLSRSHFAATLIIFLTMLRNVVEGAEAVGCLTSLISFKPVFRQ